MNLILFIIENALNFASKVAGVFLILLGLTSLVWYYINYKKITSLEKKIFEKQKEYDDMEHTTHTNTRGSVSQAQLDALVTKNRKPIERELNLLRMERQFILDKLPLVGYFKK